MSYNFFQGQYPIVRKQNIAKGCYDFTIFCPQIAKQAVCGQFAHIKVEGFSLRRPISICEVNREQGTIRLVFEVRGSGTAELANLNERSALDVIAPLGKGFTLLDSVKTAIVVGGGIGVPPLLQISKHYGGNCIPILGFRSANAVILNDDFNKFGATPIICTDDGTMGQHGLVTNALSTYLESNSADIIYTCGPMRMIEGVAKIAKAHGVYCEVSLEERMACGVGACLVCACKTVKSGEEYFAHVCKDGPVFKADEVVFE